VSGTGTVEYWKSFDWWWKLSWGEVFQVLEQTKAGRVQMIGTVITRPGK
jgi:hypothetical protein